MKFLILLDIPYIKIYVANHIEHLTIMSVIKILRYKYSHSQGQQNFHFVDF